ncbi:hypothetical protein EST92_02445 [Streptomyces sp. TM32]|uniref:hypothetical protein n=1 Tax=Streptomyces sp. TM32 TaxID=1652669 RepID=UPI00101107A6|nr:hypothetical protein [Streptomyces sp. TM32]RXS87879.1 hypothetical protein EST92_02445 [Streptomyces sp. TM32]
MIRRVSLAAAACAAVGFSLVTVPAHAAGAEATPAHASQKVMSGSDHVKCTRLSKGQLCIVMDSRPQSIDVIYTKKGGANIKAQLGYRMNGSSSYAGLETISDGDRATNTWKMSWPCKKAVGLIKVRGQGTFETPAATFPGC